MKEYEVSFIFKLTVTSEGPEQAICDAQDGLIDLNWSDYDEIVVEEVE